MPRPTTCSCSTAAARTSAAPVRARARRLARPRPGDDRPGADLRDRRACTWPKARCPTTCRWCWSSPRPSRRARRAPSWPRWRTSSTSSSARCDKRRQPLRQRAGRAARTGRREGAAGERARRSADRRELGRAAGVRRLLVEGSGAARPAAADPHRAQERPTPPRSARHERACYGFLFQVYPYICFTVFLMGSLIRFDQNQYTWKSDSSQMLRAGMLRWGSNLFHVGILFLFFGHLVGLFTPHCRVRCVHERGHEADAGDRGRRHRRRRLLRRPVAAAVPAHVRPAHPPDQPPHRHCDSRHPVGAAGRRPDHAAVLLAARRRQRDADPGRLGAAHRHLAPGGRQRAGRLAAGPTCSTSCSA